MNTRTNSPATRKGPARQALWRLSAVVCARISGSDKPFGVSYAHATRMQETEQNPEGGGRIE